MNHPALIAFEIVVLFGLWFVVVYTMWAERQERKNASRDVPESDQSSRLTAWDTEAAGFTSTEKR